MTTPARPEADVPPISGQGGFPEGGPLQALDGFYHAFNARDGEGVRLSWADLPGIAMSNPVGGLARGREEVASVYARLFGGPARVFVELHDYEILETAETFFAVGRERDRFRMGEVVIDLAIRTSRLFWRVDGRWRQVHHHGSIESPDLLDRYRSAVSGGKETP